MTNVDTRQQVIMIMICLILAIVVLMTCVIITGHESTASIGASIAGPIVSLRGIAYLKTGEYRKGWAQLAAGTGVLAMLSGRMMGLI